jgi:hypothetical protein
LDLLIAQVTELLAESGSVVITFCHPLASRAAAAVVEHSPLKWGRRLYCKEAAASGAATSCDSSRLRIDVRVPVCEFTALLHTHGLAMRRLLEVAQVCHHRFEHAPDVVVVEATRSRPLSVVHRAVRFPSPEEVLPVVVLI